MIKKRVWLVLLVSFIFINACNMQLDKESILQSDIKTQEQPETETSFEDDIINTKGLGKLCSSLVDCFAFCRGNSGRCIDFCKKNPSHELCKIPEPAKPQEWVKDAITQPLPEGASQIRLTLPAPLDKIDLTKIGSYGAHRGGHPEGLNHEWISIPEDEPVRSWADGEVVYASLNDPNRPEYRVIIYYGDGLWGEHMHVRQPLVKEGDRVKAGDPVAWGEISPSAPGLHSAEFNIADQHRRDGDVYWYKFVKGATLVSPFDYLKDDIKQQLEDKWQKDVIDAYLLKGKDTFGITPTPWEPYLTNPLLLHSGHKGEMIAEWYLRSRELKTDGIPDVLVFFESNNKYYSKQRVVGAEVDTAEHILTGDWVADYKNNRIIIITTNEVYYGIFEIDESEPQAKLKIEYQKEYYPSAFSENARIYTERLKLSMSNERFYWKPENMQYIHFEDVLYNAD